MESVKEMKKWCIVAEGIDNPSGLPILIHQKEMAPSIQDIWRNFSFFHCHITFTSISINEVKRNERSEGIS